MCVNGVHVIRQHLYFFTFAHWLHWRIISEILPVARNALQRVAMPGGIGMDAMLQWTTRKGPGKPWPGFFWCGVLLVVRSALVSWPNHRTMSVILDHVAELGATLYFDPFLQPSPTSALLTAAARKKRKACRRQLDALQKYLLTYSKIAVDDCCRRLLFMARARKRFGPS